MRSNRPCIAAGHIVTTFVTDATTNTFKNEQDCDDISDDNLYNIFTSTFEIFPCVSSYRKSGRRGASLERLGL